MKEILKKNWINFFIISAFIVFVAVSFVVNFSIGENIFKEQFYGFFKEMILFLPVMFILIGLGDVWINKEKAEKHIGKNSGFKGILLVIFLSYDTSWPFVWSLSGNLLTLEKRS